MKNINVSPLSVKPLRPHVKPRRARLAGIALRILVANCGQGGEISGKELRELIEIVTGCEWPLFEIHQALRLLRVRGLTYCSRARRNAIYKITLTPGFSEPGIPQLKVNPLCQEAV